MKRPVSRWLSRTPGAVNLALAVSIGFGSATALFGLLASQTAQAQLGQPLLGSPLQPIGTGGAALAAPAGEGITVTALSDKQFVVATREPRLVQPINGGERGPSYMLVPVITYYIVEGDGLIPLEDVRIPPGWRQVTFNAGAAR